MPEAFEQFQPWWLTSAKRAIQVFNRVIIFTIHFIFTTGVGNTAGEINFVRYYRWGKASVAIEGMMQFGLA